MPGDDRDVLNHVIEKRRGEQRYGWKEPENRAAITDVATHLRAMHGMPITSTTLQVDGSQTNTSATDTVLVKKLLVLADMSDEILLNIFNAADHVIQFRLFSRRFRYVVADVVFSNVIIGGHAWTRGRLSREPLGWIRLGSTHVDWEPSRSPPESTASENDRTQEDWDVFNRLAPLVRQLRIKFCKLDIYATR